jgi:hypothetical protein
MVEKSCASAMGELAASLAIVQYWLTTSNRSSERVRTKWSRMSTTSATAWLR